MVRDEHPPPLRYRLHRLLDRVLQVVELGLIGVDARGEGSTVDAVEFGEARLECIESGVDQRRVGPEVGIAVDDLDRVGEREDRGPGFVDVVDDTDHAGFETGAVRDEEIGGLHRLRLSRSRVRNRVAPTRGA